jgi:hypothetical protein
MFPFVESSKTNLEKLYYCQKKLDGQNIPLPFEHKAEEMIQQA